MRKILSTALVLTMVISLLVPANFASASEGKIFSLDLSSYSESTPIVKNGVTSSSNGISVLAGNNATAPELKSFQSSEGTTKYLEFTDSTDLTKTNGSVLMDATAVASVANQSNLSIEWWGNTYGGGNNNYANKGWIFAFAPDNTSENGNTNFFDNYAYRTGFYLRPFRKMDSGQNKLHQKFTNEQTNYGTWHHYVVTRKWDEEADEWTHTLYRDGDYVLDETVVGLGTDETNGIFAIGSLANGSNFYCGAIAEFNIYTTVLSESAIEAKYAATKDAYVALLPYMNLVAPTEGGRLSTEHGYFNIIFDNYIKPETIENIVFEKSNGQPVRGGFTYETAGDKVTTLKLRYGGLEENTEYVLRIPATVTSINNIPLANPEEFIFTTGSSVIFELDLTNDVIGAAPNITNPNIYFLSSNTDTRDDFTVVELEKDGVTRKAIRMGMNSVPSGNTESYFGYSVAATQNDIVIEASYKDEGPRSNRGFRWKKNNTHLLPDTAMSSFKKDDFGFIKIKFVFEFQMDTNKYTCIAYDMNNNNSKVTECNIPSEPSTFTNMLYQQYGETNAATAIYIDHYKVYPYKTPTVISDNTTNIAQNEEAINITFSDDLNPESIEEDSVVLTNTTTNKEIPIVIDGYNEETRVMSIRPLEYLNAGNNYKISFKNISSLSGNLIKDTMVVTFSAEADAVSSTPVFKNQANQEISVLNGASAVTAEVTVSNGTSTPKNPLMFLMYFDGTGTVKGINFGTASVPARGSAPLTATLTGLTPEAGSYVKCFVLDVENGKTNSVLPETVKLPY